MPRGQAIPGLREQLFSAAERVLAREGPMGLTGRAVTREAGCATGLLHNHFGDFDQFLAEFLIDRFRLAAENVAKLPAMAGQRTVAENLSSAALSLLESSVLSLTSLVTSGAGRPLRERAAQALGAAVPEPFMLQQGFAAYLEEEKKLGRVRPDTDTKALALALVATVHHVLVARDRDAEDVRARVRGVVAALAEGAAMPPGGSTPAPGDTAPDP